MAGTPVVVTGEVAIGDIITIIIILLIGEAAIIMADMVAVVIGLIDPDRETVIPEYEMAIEPLCVLLRQEQTETLCALLLVSLLALP